MPHSIISLLPSDKYRVRLYEGRQYLASRTFATQEVAEEWARLQVAEIDRVGAGLVRAHRVTDTVGDLLDEYVTAHVVTMASAESTTNLVKSLRAGFGALNYSALTPDAVANWIARRSRETSRNTGKRISPDTVRRELGVLGGFLRWCYRSKRLPPHAQHPIRDVEKPKPTRPRKRRLESDEQQRLIEAMQDHAGDVKGAKRGGKYRVGTRNPWMLPLFEFAIETAMRKEEAVTLTWANVNLEKRTAFLPKTKNGDERTVPLTRRAAAILNGLPHPSSSDDDRVFRTTAGAVKEAWKRARKRAGVKGLRFHDLRREAASRLAKKIPNAFVLMAVTGHRDPRSLAVYYKTRPEEIVEMLDKGEDETSTGTTIQDRRI